MATLLMLFQGPRMRGQRKWDAVLRLIESCFVGIPFDRHVAMLVGGTAAGQLIALLALPILTRLYNPSEYGEAAAFIGIISLVAIIASLRYQLAIPLPRNDRAGLQVALVAGVVVVIVTSLLGAGLLIVNRSWSHGSDWLFLLLLVVAAFTTGLYDVANYWAIRKQRYRAMARNRIQQGIAGVLSQIVFGLAGFGALGLIVGQIIGRITGLVRLGSGVVTDARRFGTKPTLRRTAWAILRYKRFPIYDTWAGLLNMASSQAPVILFAVLFSPITAGYYAIAVRIASVPTALIGGAVAQVLLPRIGNYPPPCHGSQSLNPCGYGSR